MLGHLVKNYFKTKGFEVKTTNARFPSSSFDNFISSLESVGEGFIVNCIGSIPQKTKSFEVNFSLPQFLDENAPVGWKIIHPGTDCEKDNTEYGMSKKKGSDWIRTKGKNTKIIQASIIGPELLTEKNSNGSSSGLFHWFMFSPIESTIEGYSHHLWNGVTTLEWTKFCHTLIEKWDDYNNLIVIQGETYSKFEILSKIKSTFERKIALVKKTTPIVDKTLSGEIKVKNLDAQLEELKKYMNNHENQYERYFA